MKIGLFFGSFNPIHIGHLIIADAILEKARLNEVWFVVSPHNPFKEKSELADVNMRMSWVKACISNHPRLKLSDIETQLPLPSYTEQTLNQLADIHPNHQFHIIVGSDSYVHLPKWKNAERWMHKYPIEVYPRISKDPTPMHTSLTHFHELPLIPISATSLREKIMNGQNVFFWIPEIIRGEVEKYYNQET